MSRATPLKWATRVVLFGAPGAGKGTQSRRLSDRLGVPHIASGDLFREAIKAGTPLGASARRFIDRGELVPDELALQVVLDRISRPDAEHGFILDGFPRTIRQAEALDEQLSAQCRALERVVELRVPTDQLIERIAGRAARTDRSDDRAGIVSNRLRVYLAQTAPLVDYYRTHGLLVPVDGIGTVEEVTARVEQALERSNPDDEPEHAPSPAPAP
jgi:adenylate kinase